MPHRSPYQSGTLASIHLQMTPQDTPLLEAGSLYRPQATSFWSRTMASVLEVLTLILVTWCKPTQVGGPSLIPQDHIICKKYRNNRVVKGSLQPLARLKILCMKVLNRTRDKDWVLESNMHWEQVWLTANNANPTPVSALQTSEQPIGDPGSKPIRPHHLQKAEMQSGGFLRHLRHDLVHPQSLLNSVVYLRDLSSDNGGVLCLCFLRGTQHNRIKETLEVFLLPSNTIPSQSQQPKLTALHPHLQQCGWWTTSPLEAQVLLQGRPKVLLHYLSKLLLCPGFCLHYFQCYGTFGQPVPISCFRGRISQYSWWHPLLPEFTTVFWGCCRVRQSRPQEQRCWQ